MYYGRRKRRGVQSRENPRTMYHVTCNYYRTILTIISWSTASIIQFRCAPDLKCDKYISTCGAVYCDRIMERAE